MKIRSGGNYLKAKEAKDGKIIVFLDAGEIVENTKYTYDDGTPRKDLIFKVKYDGEEKLLRINKASRVAMVEAFGDESEAWVGKSATIFVMPTPNGDNKMIVLKPIAEKHENQSTKEAWDE